jgi:hypothetical protein
MFLQVGGGFGGEKYKEEQSSNSYEDKLTLTLFDAYLGFNFFFAKNLAITPMIGYNWKTYKDSDSDFKTNYRGSDFGIGFRYFPGFR